MSHYPELDNNAAGQGVINLMHAIMCRLVFESEPPRVKRHPFRMATGDFGIAYVGFPFARDVDDMLRAIARVIIMPGVGIDLLRRINVMGEAGTAEQYFELRRGNEHLIVGGCPFAVSDEAVILSRIFDDLSVLFGRQIEIVEISTATHDDGMEHLLRAIQVNADEPRSVSVLPRGGRN